MTAVQTAVFLLTKPLLDNDSGFKHGFGAKATLSLTQSTPAVSHDTISLCWFVITWWEYPIYADAVRALSWIFKINFFLSDGESPRLVRYVEVELVMKPWHPSLIRNIFVI